MNRPTLTVADLLVLAAAVPVLALTAVARRLFPRLRSNPKGLP